MRGFNRLAPDTALARFKAALFQQWRVIGALLLREIRTRNGSHRLGYLMTFVDLSASILVLSVMYTFISHTPPLGTNVVMFMTSGMFVLRMFGAIEGQVKNAISANRALLGYPPVKTLDVFLARFILEIVNYATLILILGTIFSVTKIGMLPADPLKVVWGFTLVALLGLSFGMASCVFFHFFPFLEKLYGYAKSLLMVGSAIFFLPESIPVDFRIILEFNPLVHVVTIVREGFYQGYQSQYDSQIFTLSFIVVCFVIGLSGERIFRKQLLLPA